jgi:radical SAM protein with 4Fe4S-binding SPASM domain
MKQYIPLSCVWEMTLQCNMHCIHCGSKAGDKRENELTLEESMRVANDLFELGCRRISLIGGEIFLYYGWEHVARVMSRSGILVNIITNGYKFGDEEIEKIKYAGLTNVCFSVDGMEENHDRIRNRKNSFKKVLKGFARLRKEDIPFAVVTTLLDFNFHDLENMYDLFVKNKVSAWQIQLANLMGNMNEHKQHAIKAEKIPLITKFIRQKKEANKMNIYAADDIGYYDENEKHLRGECGEISYWPGCQAGLTVVGIDSIGNVKGCESLYSEAFIEGNVRKESLKNIWFNEHNFLYNRKFTEDLLTGNCAKCDMGAFCRGGCKGSSYFNKGYLFENPYCIYGANKTAGCASGKREIPNDPCDLLTCITTDI